jgi:hypothetical protein
MQERLLVYQRAGEPCPRCGRPIRRIVVGGRATHFCSWCQRLPAADRPRAAAVLRGMVPRPGRKPARRGGRWTDLPGEAGEVGRRLDGTVRERAERARRAAASRRAAARGTTTGVGTSRDAGTRTGAGTSPDAGTS